MTCIQDLLLKWYEKNKRQLPWRDTCNPYKIWVSEVVLQQTRVNQGLNYYLNFIEKFPNIKVLASAQLDEVLMAWKGLGYYSRARNMHLAAQYIDNECEGRFPSTYADLKKLKGIGPYTAAAVASIAFGQPHAVVDGNVIRAYARLFNVDVPVDSKEGRNEIERIAAEQLYSTDPGKYNQAIMELGATICTPRNPKCNECPLVGSCKAFLAKSVALLPVKGRKVQVRTRFFNFLVCHHSHKEIYLEKRDGNDIWKGLYQFPLIETDGLTAPDRLLRSQEFKKMFQELPAMEGFSEVVQHKLTHQVIKARFIHIIIRRGKGQNHWVPVAEVNLGEMPLPRLIDSYWEVFLQKSVPLNI
jgi:A/G-specific adenine glycosylase